MKLSIKTKSKQEKASGYESKGKLVWVPNLPLQGRPDFADSLKFPDDLTKLALANVSELHGKYTQLYVFANEELSRTNVEILRAQTQETFVMNRIFRQRPSINQIEKYRRDAIIQEDTEMEAIQRRLSGLKVNQEFARMFVTNYEKYINALSREMSRRSRGDLPTS